MLPSSQQSFALPRFYKPCNATPGTQARRSQVYLIRLTITNSFPLMRPSIGSQLFAHLLTIRLGFTRASVCVASPNPLPYTQTMSSTIGRSDKKNRIIVIIEYCLSSYRGESHSLRLCCTPIPHGREHSLQGFHSLHWPWIG